MCTGPRTGGCSRSFTPPGGFVYGDKETASSMVTVLFRFRMTYGPRTRYFRIFLNDNRLQKPIVRGPYFFEGTANKVILHYIVSQWITKSCCSRSAAPAGSCINPSATAKLKYVLFSVIPYGSADPSLRLTAASMVTRKRLRLWRRVILYNDNRKIIIPAATSCSAAASLGQV